MPSNQGCQFGWDWGPMLPSIGIWKKIRLQGQSVARIEDVHLRQVHKNGVVTVLAKVEVQTYQNSPLLAKMKIINPDSSEFYDVKSPISNRETTLEIRLENPLFWWPNGYGKQNLYEVSIILEAEGRPIEHKSFKIGIRTIELRQEDDEFGKSFQFIVNGVPIFAKGSNWIPVDSFITRFSDERLEKLILDAVVGHQNMLRSNG